MATEESSAQPLLTAHRAELRNHLTEILRKLSTATRRINYQGQPNSLSARFLLDHAVTVTAASRGVEVPKLARPLHWGEAAEAAGFSWENDISSDIRQAVGDLLASETDWLSSHGDLLYGYGSELLRATAAAKRSGLDTSITSSALEDVVTAIAGTLWSPAGDSFSIYDPTCGAGTLLNGLARLADGARIYGQDMNREAARIGAQNLFIAGRDATIQVADTIAIDAFRGATYDIVVADAPFGLQWDPEAQGANTRFSFTSPRNDATFMFLQAMLEKLKPAEQGGGIGIFLSAVGPLTSTEQASAEIREHIGGQRILHSIIALPDGLSARTSIRLFALVFSTQMDDSRKDHIKLVDLRGHYEDNLYGPERRKLKDQALGELKREIGTPRDSAIGRYVSAADLSFRKLSLGIPGAATDSPRRPDYWMTVPSKTTVEDWLAKRYPVGPQPTVLQSGFNQVLWDIDRVFQPKDRDEAQKAVTATGWPGTRLSMLTANLHLPGSATSAPPAGENLLLVPLAASHNTVTGNPGDEPVDRPGVIVELVPELDAAFAAGWLNSPAGRLARKAAASTVAWRRNGSPIARSVAWWLVDEIVVPVPEPGTQAVFVAASAEMAAARKRLSELDESMWRSPGHIGDARTAAGLLLKKESLDDWADTLPYPIASALATLLSIPRPTPQNYRHFWEATTIFLASYLLGALRKDESLWKAEVPRIAAAVEASKSSFGAATFGTWKVTLDLLSKLFREGLKKDGDEHARYSQLLGDPPRDLISRILDTGTGSLINKALTLRNKMDGHGGAISHLQADQQSKTWETLTLNLRDAIGNGFTEFILVRPGELKFGDTYRNKVIALTGPGTPFKRRDIESSRPIPNDPPGYLYLVSPQSGGFTRIAPFVRVGGQPIDEEPDDADFTCYFYNRREGGRASRNLRFVPYQRTMQEEIVREYQEVLSLVEELVLPSEEAP